MLGATVEHGDQNMDLDLITALTAPKTKLAELPTLKNIETPEAEPDVFTALMDDDPSAQPPETISLTLEWPVQMPMAAPQTHLAKAIAEGEIFEGTEADTPLKMAVLTPPSDVKASKPRTDHPLPVVSFFASRPDSTTPKLEVSSTLTSVQVSTKAKPEFRPVLTSTAPIFEPSAPAKPDTKGNSAAIPTPSATMLAPTTTILADPAKPGPNPEAEIVPTRAEPSLRVAALPAPQPAPQAPALPVQFANLDQVPDDPAEVQFSIKIERQNIEMVHVSRATAPPAPVANQISTQLPNLLSKAEKQTVELRLDPPELGRVTIHLTTHDQQVTAQVVAERVQTVDLMRQHADLLTATLARAGFSEANLSFQQGQGEEKGSEQFQTFTGTAEGEPSPPPAATLTGQDGRLDIRL